MTGAKPAGRHRPDDEKKDQRRQKNEIQGDSLEPRQCLCAVSPENKKAALGQNRALKSQNGANSQSSPLSQVQGTRQAKLHEEAPPTPGGRKQSLGLAPMVGQPGQSDQTVSINRGPAIILRKSSSQPHLVSCRAEHIPE